MARLRLYFTLFLSLSGIGVMAQPARQITMEDVWAYYRFFPNFVSSFQFQQDGTHYTRLEQGNVVQYDITTGEQSAVIFEASALGEQSNAIGSYSFTGDESRLLVGTAIESIYRRSSLANYFVYDIQSKSAFPVSEEGKQRDVALSPDNAKLAFTRDNNIYVKDLSSQEETQITSDGKVNEIINGSADWVYEEELSLVRAFEWSPDGKKIAYLKFDESGVEEFTMLYYNNDMYPESYTFRYPKVGEDNAIVTLHVYDLTTGKTTDVKFENKKEYIPRINWTSDADVLCVMRLNRLQNDVELTLVNTKTGDQSILLQETTEYYLAVENTDWLTFLDSGEEFIWASERDGWRHLYLYNMDGKLVRQITKGEWDVTGYYGVDEAKKVVYYQGMEGSSINSNVYAIGLNGKKKRRLSTANGSNSAQFSGDFSYYVLNHSSLAAPPSAAVMGTNSGQIVRVIEDNKTFSDRIARYGVQNPESFVITSEKGIEMNAWKITPSDFDKNKAYPVLMYVYGGPDSQVANNAWLGPNYGWFQLLAQQGYIVVGVDGRGTSGKGVAYRKAVYKELGKYETIDYIDAAKWLGQQSYVDAKRIGIFGWSYGGFQASLCILKGSDVFKAAVAVAPVTNWKWYDTIYTERYMQTLDLNESGYEDNSPINFADHLEGAYFIAHGLGDDNVHPQHSLEMINALIRANKDFESYLYPNRNHGIFGGTTRLHLFNRMTEFLKENL